MLTEDNRAISHTGRSRPSAGLALVLVILALIFLWSLMIFQGFEMMGSGPPSAAARDTALPIGKRLMVIAPHPDDEGLAAAGLISHCVAEGKAVEVVFLTNGDGNAGAARKLCGIDPPGPKDYQRMGRARAEESVAAMKELGLPRRDLAFLTFPDGGLNSLWDGNWDYGNPHRGRNGGVTSPYASAYRRGVQYCGAAIVKDLESLVENFKPSAVLYPDAQDDHHDHWAANAFLQYVLTETGCKASQYTYLVHRRDFPWPRKLLPRHPLEPPEQLAKSGTAWHRYPLSDSEERLKANALAHYEIPRWSTRTFIGSFLRTNELMGTAREVRVPSIGDDKPDLWQEPMPFVVNSDPPERSSVPLFGRDSEIEDVALARGSRISYLGWRVGGDVSSGITYVCRLRLFAGRHVSRADIEVKGGKVTFLTLAHNSITLQKRIPIERRRRRLWMELPSTVFKGRNAVMFSVESLVGGRRAYCSSWRVYKL